MRITTHTYKLNIPDQLGSRTVESTRHGVTELFKLVGLLHDYLRCDERQFKCVHEEISIEPAGKKESISFNIKDSFNH
jgi:hypothetical protein